MCVFAKSGGGALIGHKNFEYGGIIARATMKKMLKY